MQRITSRLALLVGTSTLVVAAWPMSGRASASWSEGAQRVSLHAVMSPTPARVPRHTRRTRGVVPHRPALLNPAGLRIAPSNFSPATVSFDAVEDNAAADTASQDQFSQFHSTTYANLGRISGYLQVADWTPAGGTVRFWYLGSFFADAAMARAAYNDSLTQHQGRSAQVQSCTGSTPVLQAWPTCTYMLTQNNQLNLYFADYAWAVGSCLIETDAQFPQSLDAATGAQVQTTLSAITSAAGSAASAACTSQGGPGPTATATIPVPPATATPTRPAPTATPTKMTAGSTATATATTTATPTSAVPSAVHLTILDVRVERNGAKADLTKPSLRVVKAGQKALLSIYVNIEEGAAGSTLTFTFSAKHGGAQVLSKTSSGSVPATLPAELRQTVVLQPSKQGKYTFTGTVIAQGKSQHLSTMFTVAGSTKHQCVTIDGAKYCTNA